jgi:hypothetical protein
MIEVPYSTSTEYDALVAEHKSLGHILCAEKDIKQGKFLIFNDNLPQINAKQKYAEAIASDPAIQKLAAASFTEISAWVDTNVTTVAQARTLFKKMLMVLSYLLNKD